MQRLVRSSTQVPEKYGSRRSRLSMGPLIGYSQIQLLWSRSGIGYRSELTVANKGAHILGAFEKHPHLGVSRPPLVMLYKFQTLS